MQFSRHARSQHLSTRLWRFLRIWCTELVNAGFTFENRDLLEMLGEPGFTLPSPDCGRERFDQTAQRRDHARMRAGRCSRHQGAESRLCSSRFRAGCTLEFAVSNME